MTESEWNICTDPQPMLEFLRGKASDRKLRLFAVACCRSVWHLLALPSRRAVQLLEAAVDDEAIADEEWQAINGAAREGFHASMTPACHDANAPRTPGCAAAFAVVKSCAQEAMYAASRACYQSENAHARSHRVGLQMFSLAGWKAGWKAGLQASLLPLRDIFSGTARSVSINAAWLTPTVVSLAQAIYDDRAFDRMPILADALEEAGCTDASILEHCRSGGEHVRGCWAVDLVLGKE